MQTYRRTAQRQHWLLV
jgi:hypothetical protein